MQRFYVLMKISSVFTAPVELNGLDDGEEEVILEQDNREAGPQLEMKGAEEEARADVAPGPSRPAGASQPPDEEQAGEELLCLVE